MSSIKKISLFPYTGIVTNNMMGNGITLLPANLASIGSITILGTFFPALNNLISAGIIACIAIVWLFTLY